MISQPSQTHRNQDRDSLRICGGRSIGNEQCHKLAGAKDPDLACRLIYEA